MEFLLLFIAALAVIIVIFAKAKNRERSNDKVPDLIGENSLLIKLTNVNLHDPDKRQANTMDEWYRKMTPMLMHNGGCLAYISQYGYLEDTFWKNVALLGLKPEQDTVFQNLLISVNETEYGVLAYCHNLLFHYGQRWSLMPEIEQILDSNPKYDSIKNTYALARSYAQKKGA